MAIPFHIPTNHVQRFQFVSQKLFHALQQLHEKCVASVYIWRHWSLRRLSNWLVQSYLVTVPSLHLGPVRLSSSLATLLYHLYYPPLWYMVGVLPLEQLWWNVGNYSLQIQSYLEIKRHTGHLFTNWHLSEHTLVYFKVRFAHPWYLLFLEQCWSQRWCIWIPSAIRRQASIK